jgi:hypothetical protein
VERNSNVYSSSMVKDFGDNEIGLSLNLDFATYSVILEIT